MIIIDYQRNKHQQIIHACVLALKHGKSVVYPTDTSYGLAVDVTNSSAWRNLYRIKGRDFKQPTHVVIPSISYAKKVGHWNRRAEKLTKKFWPGPLSLVLLLRSKMKYLQNLAGQTDTIGLRFPHNQIALDLAKTLGQPISATGANRLGQGDSYSLKDIQRNFAKQKYKPDIIINVGRLPKRKPSTLVKIVDDHIDILRPGPVSQKQIQNVLNK